MMEIPPAVPGRLIPLVNTLTSQLTQENAALATSALEAAFYASLRGGMMQTGKLVNWVRETSIYYVNEIQELFNLANLCFVALSARDFLSKFQERYDFSIVKDGSRIGLLKSAATFATVSTVVFLGWNLINQFSTPLAGPQTIRKQAYTVDIAETFSPQQKAAKVLYLTRLVLNIATACLVKNRFRLAASLAISSYSLWKNIQFKWIYFSREFPSPSHLISKLKATYHMLALTPAQIGSGEICGICREEQFVKPLTFCTNHHFCQSCVAEIILAKSAGFADFDSLYKTSTRHYKNGVYTNTTHAYSATIDQKRLPFCPCCRSIPLQHTLSLQLTDREHGKFNVGVKIQRTPIDRQYLFENLSAIYSTAQAGLAFLQTYPELAATIYKIQTVMLVTDLIGYVLTNFYLVKRGHHASKSKEFKITTLAAVCVIGALSSVLIWGSSFYSKSGAALSGVLSQMGLSADVLKTLKVSFDSPTLHKVMQTLFINRVIASAALLVFSNQKKTVALTVATQLASFIGISALKWVKVIQTIEEPLRGVVASGGNLLNRLKITDAKSCQVTHYFLISSSCLTHLQSTLKSIIDFTVSFFKKSSWEKYWKVLRTGTKKLDYRVTIQKSAVEACGCTLTPYLFNTTLAVVDASMGVVQATCQGLVKQ